MTNAKLVELKPVQWLLTIPDHVPKDTRRYYLYWKATYFVALLGHVFGLVSFGLAGVTFMFWFNLVSVPLFIAAIIFLQRGHYRLPFWVVNAELILHGVAATICIGPITGVQTFIGLAVILWFMQPFYGLRISCLCASTASVVLLGLMLYVWNETPLYQLSYVWNVTFTAVYWSAFPLCLAVMILPFITEARRAEKALEAAYGESEGLLLNILPEPIAARLKRDSGMIADDHDKVAVMFADIVDFTKYSDRLHPAEVVEILNDVFNACDQLADKYGVEKIKTIGDAYMAVAGLPFAQKQPEAILARMAIDMVRTVSQFKFPGTDEPVRLRTGMNCGRVVAGVIGQRKFAYDLWGDAVNVAARMEATGEPGKIQVPDYLADQLSDRFDLEPRGNIEVKGKGMMGTSFLISEKPSV